MNKIEIRNKAIREFAKWITLHFYNELIGKTWWEDKAEEYIKRLENKDDES